MNFVISQIPWRVSLLVVITHVDEILACLLTPVLGIYMPLLGTFKVMPLIEILVIFRICSSCIFKLSAIYIYFFFNTSPDFRKNTFFCIDTVKKEMLWEKVFI